MILRREDSLFGLDSDPGRAISRDTVAAVAVQVGARLRLGEQTVHEVGGWGGGLHS